MVCFYEVFRFFSVVLCKMNGKCFWVVICIVEDWNEDLFSVRDIIDRGVYMLFDFDIGL